MCGSFNFRLLRKKTPIWFPSVYFPLQGYSSTHHMGQCCRLFLPLPSLLPPATCSHSPSQLECRHDGCWRHQGGSGSKDGEKWERGTGFPMWYWQVVVLGHPIRAIPRDINDLSLHNHLRSLSPPMKEVTVVQGDEGPCPRELISGSERWPQAHGWVEIIRGRSSCQEMH